MTCLVLLVGLTSCTSSLAVVSGRKRSLSCSLYTSSRLAMILTSCEEASSAANLPEWGGLGTEDEQPHSQNTQSRLSGLLRRGLSAE